MCRSRRELSNAYLLAKIGVDTAENESLEVWGENSIQYSLHSLEVTELADFLQGDHELLAAQRMADGTSLEEVMGALDIDKDGRVTWEEFSNYCIAKLSSPTTASPTASSGSKARQMASGFLQGATNIAERITGRDLDGDGDVGTSGNIAAAMQKRR